MNFCKLTPKAENFTGKLFSCFFFYYYFNYQGNDMVQETIVAVKS